MKKSKKEEVELRSWKELYKDFKSNVDKVESETDRFFNDGIKKSAREARKALQNIRKIARDLRVVINIARKKKKKK